MHWLLIESRQGLGLQIRASKGNQI